MRWRNRRSVLVGLTCAVAIVGACTPPDRPTGPGGTAPGAPASRAVVSRDIDRPPPPDCSRARYEDPDRSALPEEFDDHDYELTSGRIPERAGSVHHLCGQRGPGVDLAWGITKGRDDVLIAVLDSGIEWQDPEEMAQLADAAYLNQGELPPPSGSTVHDANGDGRFTISDYADDPLVVDRNENGVLDPQDLILDPRFSDGVDDDGNGYVDDISGWDLLWGDNDPYDDVRYGHGTGEARDSTAPADGEGAVGTCPDCRFLPVRVADSFIADGNRFAAGVLFSLDSGADVIQEALGALNNPPQAQQAVDAAYARGVPVVASMADEASKHPNLPAAMDHTIPVNSITRVTDFLGALNDLPGVETDVLALNGCTNRGAIAWVAVPSSSCSSGATGLGAGMVGLIVSAARDAGLQLSANEVAQLLRATADDVDFATPRPGEPANEQRPDPFNRYPTTPGWDATFGFGRVNAFEAVRAASEGEIPPEADLTGPRWFEVLAPQGTVEVRGAVGAPRSPAYDLTVQWTTGLQPPPHPGEDVWRTVEHRSGLTAPVAGTLARLDLAEVAAAPPASHGDPEDRSAVRIRVVVTDAEGRHAVAQRQVFVEDDPTWMDGYPLWVDGVGASSPVFADLVGDEAEELVVATDHGVAHVLDAQGRDVPGWPQRTEPSQWWPSGSPTAAADGIEQPHDAVGVGAPVVADLDGDGSPEVAVTDAGGRISVWAADGTLRWRRAVDPALSQQSATDEVNRLKPGFLASPAAGDLDGDGDLELVAAALDRHVYAWHHDGRTVEGFPVLLVDPHAVRAVDPQTHAVELAGTATLGGELIVTPAVGDLDGDGRDEIVVGAQEAYFEGVDVFPAIGIPGVSGNTRLYAIWGDGAAHPSLVDRFPVHPHEQAYLPGWPTKLPMLKTEVLPTVGAGVNTQAAIGDVTGDGVVDVVATSSAGPIFVLDRSGRSALEAWTGLRLALPWVGSPFGGAATSQDGGVIVSAFGGPALGDLDGDGVADVAAPTVGLRQALDQLLPGDQQGDTQLSAWSTRDLSRMLPGFPFRTSDLAFFVTPAIVDVDGDGDRDVVAGNGVQLVDAVDARGQVPAGFPKLTGGWVVGTPGFGDLDGDGSAEMAVTRRDGLLLVWRTGAASDSLDGWSRFGHDGRNSGDLRTPR